jgi:HK97 family phage portal protein
MFSGILGAPSRAGINVTRERALSVPAVWAAVDTVSKTLASLPFELHEKTPQGSRPATDHPLYYRTRHEPADYVTGYNFRRGLFAQACFGNAYAKIVWSARGGLKALELLDSNSVLPFQRDNGAWAYRVTRYMGTKAVQEILFDYEVLHIKGITLDGMVGGDVAQTHRETLGLSIAANEWGAAFFGNGAHISGVIQAKHGLKPGEADTIQKRWNEKYGGFGKAGKTAVLDTDMEFKRIGLTPEEAMLNESRNFQVNETARIFGIPAHLLQQLDRATFNNIETMNTQFVTLCLIPWAVQVEQEFRVKLLTKAEKMADTLFWRFRLNGLLRGDTESRAAFYTSGIQNGWLTPNDVRSLEDMNLLEGGDRAYIQQNMMPIDSVDDILMQKNEPEPMAQPQADEPQNQEQDEQEPGAARG